MVGTSGASGGAASGIPGATAGGAAGGGQARTRLARGAVIAAARELFGERGYAATTIDAISARSEVPSATVYRLFSSKLALLETLFRLALSGDEQQADPGDLPHVRALFADPDPRRLLAGVAGVTRDFNERGTGIFQILVSAAGSDQKAAELLADYTRKRQQGQGRVTEALARAGALRPAISEQDAADLIYAIASPEVYRLLVADRGWTPQRYQEWLAATLIVQLLPAAAEPAAPEPTAPEPDAREPDAREPTAPEPAA